MIALRNKDCKTIDDAYSGEVDCEFPDGSRYQGPVINNDEFSEVFSRNGTYTNPSGQIFTGTFKDGRFLDEGRSIQLEELDQCKPEGLSDCVIALRNKDCTTIDPDYFGEVDCTFNGARYQGPVINDDEFSGIFSGNGTYTNPSGQPFTGIFNDHEFSHEGRSITLEELDECKPEGLSDCVKALRKE